MERRKRPGSKMTREDVIEIRRLAADTDMSYREIGEMMNLGTEQVGRIVRGEQWRDIDLIPSDTEVEARMRREAPPLPSEIERSQERLKALLAAEPELIQTQVQDSPEPPNAAGDAERQETSDDHDSKAE